jgi:hypothetical protein
MTVTDAGQGVHGSASESVILSCRPRSKWQHRRVLAPSSDPAERVPATKFDATIDRLTVCRVRRVVVDEGVLALPQESA